MDKVVNLDVFYFFFYFKLLKKVNHIMENSLMGIGDPAPDFKADALVGKEFKSISLDDFKGKWLVLLFYPLDL